MFFDTISLNLTVPRHQLETQHQKIIHDKVSAKTADEMLTAISREHEFFKSLDGKLKYAEKYDENSRTK